MADSDDLEYLKAHEEMWQNFVKIIIFAASTTVICLVLLAILLL
jgi:hypothetical protein